MQGQESAMLMSSSSESGSEWRSGSGAVAGDGAVASCPASPEIPEMDRRLGAGGWFESASDWSGVRGPVDCCPPCGLSSASVWAICCR